MCAPSLLSAVGCAPALPPNIGDIVASVTATGSSSAQTPAGTGSSAPSSPSAPASKVAGISVVPSTLLLNRPRDPSAPQDYLGAGLPTAARLVANVRLPDGSVVHEVTWLSLNPELVSVDASGIVAVRQVYVAATSSTLLEPASTVGGTTQIVAWSALDPLQTATVDVTVMDEGKVALDIF